MIDQVISHIVAELSAYIALRTQISDRVVAAGLFDLQGSANQDTFDKIVVSVANITEETTYRSKQTLERRADGTSEQVRPPLKVNLFLLFVANMSQYLEAAKGLSQVLSFFQHRPAMAYATVPGLEHLEGRMIFELQSLSLEQINHLWGSFGGKYLPSVLYKVGIVEVRDRQVEAEVPTVQDIVTRTRG